jgi:succinate dehydrogenase/fumarate reductase flavoprotein subunit
MGNAEMVLRSSLERKESRPAPLGFYRVDYPEQNDKEWSCCLGIQQKDGEFKFPRYRDNKGVKL